MPITLTPQRGCERLPRNERHDRAANSFRDREINADRVLTRTHNVIDHRRRSVAENRTRASVWERSRNITAACTLYSFY
jgi:hypothetical protein